MPKLNKVNVLEVYSLTTDATNGIDNRKSLKFCQYRLSFLLSKSARYIKKVIYTAKNFAVKHDEIMNSDVDMIN